MAEVILNALLGDRTWKWSECVTESGWRYKHMWNTGKFKSLYVTSRFWIALKDSANVWDYCGGDKNWGIQ